MNIGIFTDAYYPHICGVTTSIDMLQKTLKEMGHNVYIVTANLENNRFWYYEKKQILYLPGIKTGIYGTKLTKTFSIRAYKIIKSWNLDVIHSQTEFAIGLFSRHVAKRLEIPVVHTYHTLYEDYVYYVTHGLFPKTSQKIVVKLTKYFCEKTCDGLIVPTDKMKKLFITKYEINKKIHVIPTGIDTEKFASYDSLKLKKLKKKFHMEENDFVVGTIGRVAKEKNLDTLLEAFSLLEKKNKKVKLCIVGGGPYLENLKHKVKQNHLEEKVLFTGYVDYTEINTYYHLFSCFATFSTSETQGLTVIESLASLLPTIAIDDPSFHNTIEDGYNGYLVKDSNDFVSKVMELMIDKEKYTRMCKDAKNSVYKYSKEVFASDVLKVYHRVIEGKEKNVKN